MKESSHFELGVRHFNAGRFFEAHEAWEELWLQAADAEKRFLQGLIQVAAAFHQYGRGNLRGTRSLLAAGIVKMDSIRGNHRGFALGRFREDAEEWLNALSGGEGAGSKKLPRIRRLKPRAASA